MILINREELLNKTIFDPFHPPYITYEDVINMPSIEIVNCEDCTYGEYDDGIWWCTSFGFSIENENGIGFCSEGEMRDKNGID